MIRGLFRESQFPILIDGMAERYGMPPSAFLDMGVEELNWNILIFNIAAQKQEVRRKQREIESKQKRNIKHGS